MATASAPSTEFIQCESFSECESREVLLSHAGPLTVHRPVGQASKGEVILLPGWSGPRSGPADILVFLASRLAENGWTAVRVDLRGRGDAGGGAAVDLDAMIASAAGVASEPTTKSNPPLTPSPSPPRGEGNSRVLLGICSGGNVALGAAPLKECAQYDRVVAISTFPFQPARTKTFDRRRRWKNIKQYARKALSPSTWMRLVRGEVNVARVTKNMAASEKPADGRNLKDSARDIEKELLAWKGAALFVWGGGDEEAPPARAHFEKLHAAGLGAPGRVRFHTVQGANHNFYGKAWREELLREILEFLNVK